jgi:predicted polyphosphate/ATP-dependent NAD kinase
MSKVGIIANPSASTDIRSTASYATSVGSYHKVGILRRVILALNWVGVDEILIMPDVDTLGLRALKGMVHDKLSSQVSIVEMPIDGVAEDSIMATRLMNKQEVDCIITMGGDGTNRAVAHACDKTPIVPISTGTNNVFPFRIEGTTAGLAAGIVARNIVAPADFVTITKKLNIIKNGRVVDLALVDVVVVNQQFIGARAVWDVSLVREIIATQCHPSYVGMAAIGGGLCPVAADDDHGLYVRIGNSGLEVNAVIAPGMIRKVGIEEYRLLKLNERVRLKTNRLVMLALDGEREVAVHPQDEVAVELVKNGPRVVKIREVLEEAVRIGFFTNSRASAP